MRPPVGSTPCCTRSKATGKCALLVRRAGQSYEAYADAQAELMAIKAALTY